jgi:hypothetical protein
LSPRQAMITIVRSRGLLYAKLKQTEKAKIDLEQAAILFRQQYIAFLIHKRYIPDPEQLNQQRFKCAAQMREPL